MLEKLTKVVLAGTIAYVYVSIIQMAKSLIIGDGKKGLTHDEAEAFYALGRLQGNLDAAEVFIKKDEEE